MTRGDGAEGHERFSVPIPVLFDPIQYPNPIDDRDAMPTQHRDDKVRNKDREQLR